MRILELADGRTAVAFDRGRQRVSFVWCAGGGGPGGLTAGSVLDCGATVMVAGEIDDAVRVALAGLGWADEAGWRCPAHLGLAS